MTTRVYEWRPRWLSDSFSRARFRSATCCLFYGLLDVVSPSLSLQTDTDGECGPRQTMNVLHVTYFIYCSTTAFSEFCCLFGVRPHDRVTEALINLHWLPVPGRVEFKLFVLVYKSLNGIAPSHSYIADMLQPVATLHQQVTLRSVINNDLAVPRTRLTFGERAFSVESPRLWSSLPSYHAANIHKRGWRHLHFANTFIDSYFIVVFNRK